MATLTLGIAHAAEYDIRVITDVSVGKTHLKAGGYTVEMKGDKAVFKSGKTTVEVPASVEKNGEPFASTTLLSQHSQLQEIDIAGTQDRIVFNVALARSNGN
jgi:hypothetical protein